MLRLMNGFRLYDKMTRNKQMAISEYIKKGKTPSPKLYVNVTADTGCCLCLDDGYIEGNIVGCERKSWDY